MASTVIDALVERHRALRRFLDDKGELSLAMDAEDRFKPVLVLSVASFFESEICESLHAYAARHSLESVAHFVRNKGIARQYHTFFDWSKKNINAFAGLFGDEFKRSLLDAIHASPELVSGMENFLELGLRRNELVHKNFASATIEATTEEIVAKYNSASKFVSFLGNRFAE